MESSQIANLNRDNEQKGFAACHCCGLVHTLPKINPGSVACCTQCQSIIKDDVHPRTRSRTAAIALAALFLYPVAMSLPVMQIERFGYVSEASIWSGMVGLLAEGHLFIGFVVLLFSVLAPIGKLGLLLMLCLGRRTLSLRDRARAYRVIELVGRWGMVDVLLIAVLVAIVKLGDLVTVTPGPGVIVFGAVVFLSLLASAMFDPHVIWMDTNKKNAGVVHG